LVLNVSLLSEVKGTPFTCALCEARHPISFICHPTCQLGPPDWPQVAALCAHAERVRQQLLKEKERAAALEVFLLRSQETELSGLLRAAKEAATAFEADTVEQLQAVRRLTQIVQRLRWGLLLGDEAADGGTPEKQGLPGEGSAGGNEDVGALAYVRPGAEGPAAAGGGSRGGGGNCGGNVGAYSSSAKRLPAALMAAHVAAVLRAVGEKHAKARTADAARRERAVQVGELVSSEWAEFVQSLLSQGGSSSGGSGGSGGGSDGSSSGSSGGGSGGGDGSGCGNGSNGGGSGGTRPLGGQVMQLKACTEAVVRVYLRALRDVEEGALAFEAAAAAADTGGGRGRRGGGQQQGPAGPTLCASGSSGQQQVSASALCGGSSGGSGGDEAVPVGGSSQHGAMSSRPASQAAPPATACSFAGTLSPIRMQSGAPAAAQLMRRPHSHAAGPPCGGLNSSLFDALVAHYSQDSLGLAGSQEAWRDPEVRFPA
jgi:hypothetical protein